jgi:hypothetical protein
MVEALPAAAAILATIDRPVAAAEGRAECRIQYHVRVRRDAQVAAIGHRRVAANIHILPMLAAIPAGKQAHSVGEDQTVPVAPTHKGMPVEHALDLGLADDAALVFFLRREAQQIGSAIFPAFAAVAAAHDAIGLDAAIDLVGLARIDIEPHDAAREGHMDPVRQAGIGQRPPMVAAIVAAIDTDGPGAGIDRRPIGRMDQDRPDIGLGIGQLQPLPALAAIGAAIGSLAGAEIDHVEVVRVDCDRVHVDPVRQRIAQRLPVPFMDRQAKDAAMPACRRPHRADIDIRHFHAALPPSARTLAGIIRLSWRMERPLGRCRFFNAGCGGCR